MAAPTSPRPQIGLTAVAPASDVLDVGLRGCGQAPAVDGLMVEAGFQRKPSGCAKTWQHPMLAPERPANFQPVPLMARRVVLGDEEAARVIRVVASDLDGTLLRGDLTVSERTRTAIHDARRAGVTFVAVTGRPPRSVRSLNERLGLEGIAICANGALVYDLDSDTVQDQTPLAAEVALWIVRGLREAAPGSPSPGRTPTGSVASPPGAVTR